MDITENTQVIVENLLSLLKKIDGKRVGRFFQRIANHHGKIFCCACGRSGFILRGFCMRLMHLGFQAYFVGDTTTPPIAKEDVLIVLSGSGETPSLKAQVNQANDANAFVFGIVGTQDASISHTLDDYILLEAGSKTSVSLDPHLAIQPRG